MAENQAISRDLRNAGLKVTLPRLRILEILEQAGEHEHFSAEDVYKILLKQGWLPDTTSMAVRRDSNSTPVIITIISCV